MHSCTRDRGDVPLFADKAPGETATTRLSASGAVSFQVLEGRDEKTRRGSHHWCITASIPDGQDGNSSSGGGAHAKNTRDDGGGGDGCRPDRSCAGREGHSRCRCKSDGERQPDVNPVLRQRHECRVRPSVPAWWAVAGVQGDELYRVDRLRGAGDAD